MSKQGNTVPGTRWIRAIRAVGVLGAVLGLGGTVGARLATPVRQEQPSLEALRLDPGIQAEIRAVLEAKDLAAWRLALDTLEASAGPGHGRLVPQLFLFSRRATDTREAMFFGVVRRELRLPDEHIVRALVPLLEAPDTALRRDLGGVLSEYEGRSAERGADFSVYRPYFQVDPPLGLARHLFETDPDAALLALARARGTEPGELRGLLWAQHEVADARWKLLHGYLAPEELTRAEAGALGELAGLARHPRWWARLYAARVALEEPAMRAAARLDALVEDAHPLVRECARAAAEAR